MLAIDKVLSDKGVKPFQRPLSVGRLLWEAFGWSGNLIPPKELALQQGFKGDIIMAKSYRWYEQTYDKCLLVDLVYGYAPVKLRNLVWRVRFGLIVGQVSLSVDRDLMKGSSNTLCAAEGLTQGLASQLNDAELFEYFQFYKLAIENLMWRDELPNTELLVMARADYDASTSDVLAHRYGQARWGAQQAVEKTIKGLLNIAGTTFPTGGPKGHDLIYLGELLDEKHGITLLPDTLTLAVCTSKVRYGEESSSEDQAMGANHALLNVLEQLRTSPNTANILS